MKASQIIFNSNWPRIKSSKFLVAFIDNKLIRKKGMNTWLTQFDLVIQLKAGEQLKQIETFSLVLNKLNSKISDISKKELSFFAIGGGSVGDFVGFLASVYKRGVDLQQVPSTWLAAMDSAIGGKTALNLGGAKNQIGSFYSASRIHYIRPLLEGQPSQRLIDASGELLKTAVYHGGGVWKKSVALRKYDSEFMWRLLPDLIKAKQAIVANDPFEQTGERFVLNLGHTMGHVFESLTGMSHGKSVGYGLMFAIVFAKRKGLMSDSDFEAITSHPLWEIYLSDLTYKKLLALPEKQIDRALRKDKKSQKTQEVSFVFPVRIGVTKIISIPVSEIIDEVLIQKKTLNSNV